MTDARDFGAAGDGRMDDTAALQHAIDDGDGSLAFRRGDYLITRPLVVDLAKCGRTSLHGHGGTARLVMAGPGPAILLKGTHTTSADPGGFRPEEWQHERMPQISGLEIIGQHPEADGIRIEGVMQPTLTGLLIRQVRTAVHVTQRARNLLISHCHFYFNTGVGVHLEKLNLHQAIITGSHISYCRLGGIRIEESEIRNLQITGNDIEYNNNRAHKVPDADAVPTAEIYIDTGNGSVREGTISSNTIQATYSPGGANIRFIGKNATENHKGGMWSISGNLIGSQETNIHLTSVRELTLTGNHIYSGHKRNLLVEDCRNIVVGANCFGHNPDYTQTELCTGLRFVNSVDCNISGTIIQDAQAGANTLVGAIPSDKEALLEAIGCRRLSVSGTQIIDPAPLGILLRDCSDTVITGCTILDNRAEKKMLAAVRCDGAATGNLITASRLGAGTQGTVIGDGAIKQGDNLLDA